MSTASADPLRLPLLEALAALAPGVGRPVSMAALQAQVTRNRDGQVEWQSLHDVIAGFGLELHRVDTPARAVATDALPVLAALRDGRYMLISSAQQALDPALLAEQDGWCLRVVPHRAADLRSDIPALRSARGWFWKVLWSLRGHYVHVALATVVINLLSIAISLYVMNVYDRVVPNRTYDTLWVLTIGTALALTFEFLARTLRGWLVDSAGRRADMEISSGLFARLLSIRLIGKPPSSGAFVSNLRDFEAIRDVLTSATLTALIDLPFVLLFVAVIFMIAPPLAIAPLLALVLVILIGALVQAPLARLIRVSMREGSQRHGMAVEAVEGLETLKVNNAYRHMQQRWQWFTESVADASMRSRTLSGLVVNLTGTISQLVTVSTVLVGVYLIHDGLLTLGGLIASVILAGRAIAPVSQVATLAVRLQQARAAFDGLQALIDKPIEREPDRNYLSLPLARGELCLSRVDFAHDPNGAGLFRGLNLAIKPREKVAILGRTGSGKSTLLRLAAGLYLPSSGSVTIDGIDSRQVDPAELRNVVGLLPQDSRLFLGTLRENLELARGDQPADDARLLSVLRTFGLEPFIAAHPRGLDMQLGEDGLGLSGGQRRLVALARLALRDPRVVLLDEPTSGLDQTTEQMLIKALAEWARDRTLIVVTHRPQLLELVDRIVVLDQGRVVIDGPRSAVVEQLSRGVSVPQPTTGRETTNVSN
jgi:ATP-binding cassette, subfamily C, bacterial LapB